MFSDALPFIRFAILTSFVALGCSSAFSQNHAERYILDGKLKDLQRFSQSSYHDTLHQPDSGINLKRVYTAHDSAYFFIGFTSARPLNLTGGEPREGQVYLYLDLDRKRKTGYLTGALGADVSIDFTRKVVRYNGTPESTTKLDQAGIRVMPTLSSRTFELAISRDIAFEEDTFELSKPFRFQLADKRGQETLPTYDTAFSYAFQGKPIPQARPIPMSRAQNADLRVVSHNTLDNGLTNEERAPALRRIYQTLKPDVLTLNECWDVSAAKAKRFLNRTLAQDRDEAWNTIKMDEGNIIGARYPIADKWQIAEDMRLTAARIAHPDQPFLLINAHLSCCDQNKQRKAQTRALMTFLEDGHEEGGRLTLEPGTPILVAGDMNLVGKGLTLRMLQGDTTRQQAFKPDWDYTPLAVVSNPHTHGHLNYTWQSLQSGWPAGKLDYMLYTSSAATPLRSYTLNTALMPDSLLNSMVLKANTTERASDHYPIVTDFTLSPPASTRPQRPLPAMLSAGLHTIPLSSGVEQIRIYNRKGALKLSQSPKEQIKLNLTDWQKGRYYVAYQQANSKQVMPLLVGP